MKKKFKDLTEEEMAYLVIKYCKASSAYFEDCSTCPLCSGVQMECLKDYPKWVSLINKFKNKEIEI